MLLFGVIFIWRLESAAHVATREVPQSETAADHWLVRGKGENNEGAESEGGRDGAGAALPIRHRHLVPSFLGHVQALPSAFTGV